MVRCFIICLSKRRDCQNRANWIESTKEKTIRRFLIRIFQWELDYNSSEVEQMQKTVLSVKVYVTTGELYLNFYIQSLYKKFYCYLLSGRTQSLSHCRWIWCCRCCRKLIKVILTSRQRHMRLLTTFMLGLRTFLLQAICHSGFSGINMTEC